MLGPVVSLTLQSKHGDTMPELPEVETVCRGLAPAMLRHKFKTVETKREGLRFPFPPDFASQIAGRRVERLYRRAKYMILELDTGTSIIIHLGMSGRFIIERAGDLHSEESHEPGAFNQKIIRHAAHDHVRFEMENGYILTYNDVRRFGFMDLVATNELATCRHFANMGLEPLGNGFNAQVMATLFKGRKTPLKAALLDQRLIAGLGNIYVCEALNRSGLSPLRAAGTLCGKNGKATAKAETLARQIRMVLEEAIEAGGSTLRDFAQTDGSLGYFQHRFRAYDRKGEACSNAGCNGHIERMVQSGRSTFYCASCQV